MGWRNERAELSPSRPQTRVNNPRLPIALFSCSFLFHSFSHSLHVQLYTSILQYALSIGGQLSVRRINIELVVRLSALGPDASLT